jgi:hypothetical protein
MTPMKNKEKRLMKMKYKSIIWSFIIIALCWYSFYFFNIKMGCGKSIRRERFLYDNNINATKRMIYQYYSDCGFMPKRLDRTLALNTGFPEETYTCIKSSLKLRISNPTMRNVLLYYNISFMYTVQRKKIQIQLHL